MACTFLWPLYTCLWINLDLYIRVRVPLTKPKQLVEEASF